MIGGKICCVRRRLFVLQSAIATECSRLKIYDYSPIALLAPFSTPTGQIVFSIIDFCARRTLAEAMKLQISKFLASKLLAVQNERRVALRSIRAPVRCSFCILYDDQRHLHQAENDALRRLGDLVDFFRLRAERKPKRTNDDSFCRPKDGRRRRAARLQPACGVNRRAKCKSRRCDLGKSCKRLFRRRVAGIWQRSRDVTVVGLMDVSCSAAFRAGSKLCSQ